MKAPKVTFGRKFQTNALPRKPGGPYLFKAFESLNNVASDPLVWAQHPSPRCYQEPVLREWFNEALTS